MLKIYLILLSLILFPNLCLSNCVITLDLAIIVDVSNSIGRNYFEEVIESLVKIVDRINDRHNVSVNLIRYSTTPNLINGFIFNENSKDIFLDQIKRTVLYTGAQTQTAIALRYTKTIFNRSLDPLAPRIALLFSDGLIGQSAYNFEAEARDLKAANVEIISIAVSNQINYTNLKLIASSQTHEHNLDFKYYRKLFEIINTKTLRNCNKNAFRFLKNYEND